MYSHILVSNCSWTASVITRSKKSFHLEQISGTNAILRGDKYLRMKKGRCTTKIQLLQLYSDDSAFRVRPEPQKTKSPLRLLHRQEHHGPHSNLNLPPKSPPSNFVTTTSPNVPPVLDKSNSPWVACKRTQPHFLCHARSWDNKNLCWVTNNPAGTDVAFMSYGSLHIATFWTICSINVNKHWVGTNLNTLFYQDPK